MRFPEREYLSSKEAADWLSIGEELFEALAAEYGLAPTYFGKGKKAKRWHCEAVGVIGYLAREKKKSGEESAE